MSESSEQQAVIHWRNIHLNDYPELALLHSIPNGAHMHPAHAVRMVNEGLTKGIPDLHFPYPARRYHGLWIEMKAGRGRASEEQKLILATLEKWGHRVALAYDASQAITAVYDYLAMQCRCGACAEFVVPQGDLR